MTGRDLLYSVLCRTRGGFSDLWAFVERFPAELDAVPPTSKELLSFLSSLLDDFKLNPGSSSQEHAFARLVAVDLAGALDSLQHYDPPSDIPSYLNSRYSSFLSTAGRLGLPIARKPLHVVEAFPGPYSEMNWEAMCCDSSDLLVHGIDPGIYLLRNSLRPIYSDYFLAHEAMHLIIAEPNPELLARGLEEGLCDLLGGLYLCLKEFGMEITANLFTYIRLFAPSTIDSLTESYVEYDRLAAVLYYRYGLRGLTEIARSGRSAVKEFEGLLVRGADLPANYPSGDWDPNLTHLIDMLLGRYIRSLVVSPLALLVAPFAASTSATVESISDHTRLPVGDVQRALEELQERVFLLVLDGKRITFSDVDLPLKAGILRYEVPGTSKWSLT